MKKIILAALFLFLVAGVYGVGYSEDGSGFATFGGTRMCMSDGSVPFTGTWDFSNATVVGLSNVENDITLDTGDGSAQNISVMLAGQRTGLQYVGQDYIPSESSLVNNMRVYAGTAKFLSFYTQGKLTSYYDDEGRFFYLGDTDENSSYSTILFLINNRTNDQETSVAGNRSHAVELHFCKANDCNNDSNSRIYSIVAHDKAADYPNSGQPKQISHYQYDLMEDTSQIDRSNKLIERNLGSDAEDLETVYIGGAYLQQLEEWKGYYYNETDVGTGIKTKAGDYNILLDIDNNEGSNTFAVYENVNVDGISTASQILGLRSSVTDLYINELQIDDGNGNAGNPLVRFNDRAKVGYNSNALYLQGELGKSVKIQTDGANDRVLIDSDGRVTIYNLTNTYTGGQAYVCVNDDGVLFASETAC